MNREEFMRQLERLLRDIPEGDRLDAIAYYNDYFSEAGVEKEAQVIRELGSPEKVAETIKSNCDMGEQKEKKKSNIPWPLFIVLIIFASPILVGVGGGLLGGVIGLLGGLFGVVAAVAGCGFGFTVGGVVCLIVGVFRVFSSPLEGLVCMGVGGILGALGILCVLLFTWLAFRWIPALVKVCINGCRRIFRKGERGNTV